MIETTVEWDGTAFFFGGWILRPIFSNTSHGNGGACWHPATVYVLVECRRGEHGYGFSAFQPLIDGARNSRLHGHIKQTYFAGPITTSPVALRVRWPFGRVPFAITTVSVLFRLASGWQLLARQTRIKIIWRRPRSAIVNGVMASREREKRDKTQVVERMSKFLVSDGVG